MTRWLLAAALGLTLVGALSTTSLAQEAKKAQRIEKKITIDQVPVAVKDALMKEAGKNEIKAVEEVTTGDVKTYEADWTADGKNVEIEMAADGKVIMKEADVAMDKLPAAVQATIKKEAGANKVEELQEVTKGAEKFYQADFTADGKSVELQVAADGKVIKKDVKEKAEKKITIDQLPAAVKESLMKEADKNAIKGIEAVTVYKAEWVVDGKDVEVKIAASGKILAKETDMAMDKLPAAVQETIKKEAGANKVEELKEVVKGTDKFFQAEWTADGKCVELKNAADGKVIKKEVEEQKAGEKHEQKGEHEDKD